MAELIYGPSIDALTQDVLSEVSAMSRQWPDTRAIILVPENRKLTTERRYLEASGTGGLMMAEVLSFSRLSFRIFDMAGLTQEKRLSRESQAMLLASLIEEHKTELKLFHRLAARSGYIEHILAVLGYFRRFGVNADLLREAAESSPDSHLKAKFHDFSILLEYYQASLSRLERSDPEKGLEELAVLLESLLSGRAPGHIARRLAELRNTMVWLTGFGETRDFTPQEYRILIALNRLCQRLCITVVTDTLIDDPSRRDQLSSAYLIGSRTANSLRRLVGIESNRYVPDLRRQIKPLTDILEHNVARTEDFVAKHGKELDNFLSFHCSEHIIDEISSVAGEIRRLCLDGRYRYRDISLCLTDAAAYLPYIRTIFPAYDIPAFIDQRRSLADTPLLRFVLALLDTSISNWQQDHLLALLRSGVYPVTNFEADALENYWLASGMRYSAIFYLERYPSDLAVLLEEKIQPLRRPLEGLKAVRTCRELLSRFKAILAMPELGVFDWVRNEVERLGTSAEDNHAVSLAKAWNSLGQILTDLEELFQDSYFDVEMLRRILQVAAESNFAGIIPTDLDQVSIGNAQQLLGSENKILFILGAKNGLFPSTILNTGLLKDSDCEWLSQAEEIDLPGLNDYKAESDAFTLRQLLFTPSDRLYFTYTGTNSEAATIITLLTSVLNKPLEAIDKTIERADDYRLMSADELERQLILRSAGGQRELTGHWKNLDHCLNQKINGASVKREALIAAGSRQTGGEMPAQLTQELLRHMPNISVSALETYAACPYEYLAKYLLRVSEREIAEPTPMNRGSLLHVAFEQAFSELSTDLRAARTASEQERVWQDYLSRDSAEESKRLYRDALASNPDFAGFDSSGQRYASGRPVRKVIEAAWPALLRQMRESNYFPYSFEHSFGQHNPIPELQYKTEDGLILNLRGTIDRVDIRVLDDGYIGFRVIDYKSSEHKIDYDEILEGLDLQILTYLEAVSASGLQQIDAGLLIPEDAMYVRLDEQHHTVDEMPSDYNEAVKAALEKYYRPAQFKRTPEELALLMRLNRDNRIALTADIVAGRFDLEPRVYRSSRLTCTYCQNRQACTMENAEVRTRRLPGIKKLRTDEAEKANVDLLLKHLKQKYGRSS